jgi:hypothetical protein
MRLLSGVPMQPCCSELLELPAVVEPGESQPVVVGLRADDRSGPLSAEFIVRTDDPTRPRIHLKLSAHLVPWIEWHEPSEGVTPAVQGRCWQKTIQLRQRVVDGAPTTRPVLTGPEGVRIEVGSETQATDADMHVTETTYGWRLMWPPSDHIGQRTSVLRARWPGGAERTHRVIDEVVPRIEVQPRTVVLQRSEGKTVTLRLRSHDGPFRISSVEGEPVRSFRVLAGQATAQQTLELRVSEWPDRPTTSPIKILTDHAASPLVSLNMILVD